MKKLKSIRVFYILVALLLAMVTIAPVTANQPEHFSSVLILDDIYSNCGPDMPIHLEETYEGYAYFNQDGESTMFINHVFGTAALTYNGHTLTMNDRLETKSTVNGTVMEVRGAEWIGTVPGHGAIVGIVGNQTSQLVCKSKHKDCEWEVIKFSGMEFTDQEAICNYMLYGE